MAKYGAKYLRWAPFAETTPDADTASFPKYGDPISLGALVKVTDSPSFNEAKAFGDNALEEHVNEFKECGVAVEVTELANSVASAVLGAKIESEGGKDLVFSTEDNAPYGGLAFYINKMVKGVKSYHGIYYPKAKAAMQGTEYTTKGDSITLAGGALNFTAAAPANGKWKVESDDFPTEKEAKDWVDKKIAKASP